jgi:uncharacterized membrane-anchored protein
MNTTTAARSNPARPLTARAMLNKVPEVTVLFWIIKILATTVGETAADFISTNLKFGTTGTLFVMGGLLAVALYFQFRRHNYYPANYWIAVVLMSVFGTLITDTMVDTFHISLWTSTAIFTVLMLGTFAAWYASEHTLSIHSITTRKREAFYWLAILFTFALGTAAGDLVAEKLNLGYWKSALLFAGLIAVIYVLHLKAALNAVLAFWMAYIITRPLGASIGDELSQSKDDGGLGLGTTVTSIIFLAAILAVVVYVTKTKVDATPVHALSDGDTRSDTRA